MKLLILTQKADINNDVLGFFHDWILEFAKHCEKITVICLEKGRCELPENVKVFSLGKECLKNPPLSPFAKGGNKILYGLRFYKYIWQERKNYDAVFVHMNPEYVILGGIFWRLFKKKISLWYVHKNVDLKLRLAEKIANVIFTASRESFQIQSRKVRILGHGIKVQQIKKTTNQKNKDKENIIKIISVGRITAIKNQKLLIEAVAMLVNSEGIKNIVADFVGSPMLPADIKYLDELKELVLIKKLEKHINFIGSVPHKNIACIYNNADLSVNLCPAGGMDKTVLESMMCGCLPITGNNAFCGILPQILILAECNPEELAGKIKFLMGMPFDIRDGLEKEIREKALKNYSLDGLIAKIMDEMESCHCLL